MLCGCCGHRCKSGFTVSSYKLTDNPITTCAI
jgi:hypothetical protein